MLGKKRKKRKDTKIVMNNRPNREVTKIVRRIFSSLSVLVVAKTHSVPRCMLEDSSGSWDDKLLLKSISSVHTTISGATSEDPSDDPCLDAWGVLRLLLGDTAIWS